MFKSDKANMSKLYSFLGQSYSQMATSTLQSQSEMQKKSSQAHWWFIPLQGNMNAFDTDCDSFPIICHVKFAWNNDL